MNKDLLIINTDNEKNTYRVLYVINDVYHYIIYTSLDNKDIRKDLHAIKVRKLKNKEVILPINDYEWQMIEERHQKLID